MEEKTRILIVDDEKSTRESYIKILKSRNDLSIEQMASPGQVFNKLKKLAPDIILCGLSLPKMDGLELCRRIKSTPDLEGKYFLM
jgi:CheY-like chemotaxis protein